MIGASLLFKSTFNWSQKSYSHRSQAYDPNMAAYSAMLQSMYGLSIACWRISIPEIGNLNHFNYQIFLIAIIKFIYHHFLSNSTWTLSSQLSHIHLYITKFGHEKVLFRYSNNAIWCSKRPSQKIARNTSYESGSPLVFGSDFSSQSRTLCSITYMSTRSSWNQPSICLAIEFVKSLSLSGFHEALVIMVENKNLL